MLVTFFINKHRKLILLIKIHLLGTVIFFHGKGGFAKNLARCRTGNNKNDLKINNFVESKLCRILKLINRMSNFFAALFILKFPIKLF